MGDVGIIWGKASHVGDADINVGMQASYVGSRHNVGDVGLK